MAKLIGCFFSPFFLIDHSVVVKLLLEVPSEADDDGVDGGNPSNEDCEVQGKSYLWLVLLREYAGDATVAPLLGGGIHFGRPVVLGKTATAVVCRSFSLVRAGARS